MKTEKEKRDGLGQKFLQAEPMKFCCNVGKVSVFEKMKEFISVSHNNNS